MPRPASDNPTELEHQILKILWGQAPLPVREIRQRLADAGRESAHTSVITTLNTMVRKKYLKRTNQKNAYLFAPRVTREDVSGKMLNDLVEQVFDGSASAVVLRLFDRKKIDPSELEELRRVIRRKIEEQSI